VSRHLISLLLLLLAGPAFAEAPSRYIATTTGELVVDVDGRVASVKLDHKDLGTKVMEAFEDQIRDWRFEPVVVDGKAVRARAGMSLSLLVKDAESDRVTLHVRSVRFSEPPGTDRTNDESAAGRIKREGLKMTPPVYPGIASRAGVGGTIWLLVRVGPDGKVDRVGTRAAELMTLASLTPEWRESHLRQFADAAERSAKKWRLPGYAGTDVCVPVRFSLYGDDRRRWVPIFPMKVEAPDWARRNDESLVNLPEGGLPGPDRFRLLTSLD
jgi:hypothetical protein